MNLYELTIVLAGKATSAKRESVIEQIEKLLKTLKCSVKKTEDWGEIELSYKIGKVSTGNFTHFNLELESSSVKTFSQKLKMEDDIIRYLIVRKEPSASA